MTQSLDLIFSDCVPDRGGSPWPENPGYLVDAINVRFTPNGYRSSYIDAAADPSTTAISATPLAAAGFGYTTNPRHIVGTAQKIFESDDYGVTWYDNAGATYAATDWEFALFGTLVIAVNLSDNPQAKDLSAAIANNYADLSGSPPKARRVARIRENLVLGELVTGTFDLRWCALGDATTWSTPGSATALANGAGGFTVQPEHGLITQLVGGEKFGLIFQERAITRMTYVGGDIQFTFDLFEKGEGTGYNHSAIRVGNLIYYINSTGVFATDGYTVMPLSVGKVDDAFILGLLAHPSRIAELGKTVAYDRRTRQIHWPFTHASTDYQLCYDIALQRFSVVKLAGTYTDGTLYSVTNGLSQQDANSVPHCIDQSKKLRQFSSLNGNATKLRTGFVEIVRGGVSEITSIEVLGAKNAPNPTIRVKSVYDTTDIDLLDETSIGFNNAVKSTRSPRFQIRQAGRYHSFIYQEPAQSSATLIRGLRIYYEPKSAL